MYIAMREVTVLQIPLVSISAFLLSYRDACANTA